jgi:prevent-host-death family protein
MEVSVTDAKAQLTELVRRAEAGDDIVLTRHGHPAVRLIPVKKRLSPEERRALLEELRAASVNATPGPCAARSQDFLYDEDGLPR